MDTENNQSEPLYSVRDLINELQKYPMDADVFKDTFDGGMITLCAPFRYVKRMNTLII